MHPDILRGIICWANGTSVSADCFRSMMLALLDPAIDEASALLLLATQRIATEDAGHLIEAVKLLQERMKPFSVTQPVLDTCGTGGDHQSLFNISTATAFVLAAAEVAIVKHGNRASSSLSGSTDVLEELGFPKQFTHETMLACFAKTQFAYCPAPGYHPALKHLTPIRKKLGFPTLFNLVGPLVNPARPAFQLLGVGRKSDQRNAALVLAGLGTTTAFVLHGEPGMDEISLSGSTHVYHVQGGKVTEYFWTAKDFDLEPVKLEEVRCKDAKESARWITSIFQGETGPAERMVLANSAAGLLLTGKVASLLEGVAVARNLLRSGAVWGLLQEVIATLK